MTMIDPKKILKKVTPTPQIENNLSEAQKKEVEEFLMAVDDMDDTHRVHATI